jgi:hypothetical protein
VNIFLIPYTWMRHVAVALVCAAAALMGWWVLLAATVYFPFWTVEWDGALYIAMLCFTSAGASTMAEASYRRSPLWKRGLYTFASASLSGSIAIIGYWGWSAFLGPLIFSAVGAADLSEPTLVSLRYRLPGFLLAGMQAGLGPLALRKGQGVFSHFGAGAAAGLLAGATWYTLGYPKSFIGLSDLYLASAAGAVVFGGTFGLLAWGIPDSLYAGWLRIVSESRHGRRIPIDGADGGPRERFLGHFPRGLDVFLPAEDGVMELHISIMVTRKQEYRARGLTLQPTIVKRFLERVDLRYDPRRAAPLETRLSSGDRLLLGPQNDPTVVEFIMLPREER